MKLEEAKHIIDNKPTGYRVSFERREGGLLISDFFPDRDEKPFEVEEVAWEWAKDFAVASKKKEFVNIYVIRADNFSPVAGYWDKMLNCYPDCWLLE